MLSVFGSLYAKWVSWLEKCSRSVKLTARISISPIKLTALLLIRAVNLPGLFLFHPLFFFEASHEEEYNKKYWVKCSSSCEASKKITIFLVVGVLLESKFCCYILFIIFYRIHVCLLTPVSHHK